MIYKGYKIIAEWSQPKYIMEVDEHGWGVGNPLWEEFGCGECKSDWGIIKADVDMDDEDFELFNEMEWMPASVNSVAEAKKWIDNNTAEIK